MNTLSKSRPHETELSKKIGGILFSLTTWVPALVVWVAYPVQDGVVRGFFGMDVPLSVFVIVSTIGGAIGLSLTQDINNRGIMILPGAVIGAGVFIACELYTSIRHSIFILEIAIMILLGMTPGALLYAALAKLLRKHPKN